MQDPRLKHSAYAPVALFVYNRPEHTRQTMDALLANFDAPETDVVVFSDGPKNAAAADSVRAVRALVENVTGFKSLQLIKSPGNRGLAASIISGVSEMCARYGRVIVLEDDMVTSKWFLRFMNDALSLYSDEEEVISVHGYRYPSDEPVTDNFFLRGADCWGWATWTRGWKLFEADGAKLLGELRRRGLVRSFDYDGAYPFSGMLEDQINGLNDSWAIRWLASAYLADRFTLYPSNSLLNNIGNDSSGTHSRNNNRWETSVSQHRIQVTAIPIREDLLDRTRVAKFLKTIRGGPIVQTLRSVRRTVRYLLLNSHGKRLKEKMQ